MIKRRIIQLLEYKGIPKEEFYIKIGMTSASFRGRAKNTPLNSNAIENIFSEMPDINPEWLLTGKGDMIKKESSKNEGNNTNTEYEENYLTDNSQSFNKGIVKQMIKSLNDTIKTKDELLKAKDEIIQLLRDQLNKSRQ